MKILLIDDLGSMLDFSLRCEEKGHSVRLWVRNLKNGTRSNVGKGLITRIPQWETSMNWADIIIVSDNCKSIKKLDVFRRRGYPIFGPNENTANWEINRDVGIDIFKRAGIPTIPSVKFTRIQDAISYIKKNLDKRFVSKPCGDAAKHLSYVSKSSEDMLFMLEYWDRLGKIKAPFIIQEFIPGIEVAVGGWFGLKGFSKYFIENFEHKKLLNNDLGPNTGESGTIMKYVTESKLAEMVLKPLEGLLHREGYTGYIDVAVIVDKKGNVWPLEFTTRPGFPIFQIQQILHPDPVDWMLDMINGFDSFYPSSKVAAGIRICLPDYPFNHAETEESTGFPVYGITSRNRKYIHPDDVMLGEAPLVEGNSVKTSKMFVSCGTTVLAVSGVGDTVEEACKHMYKNVSQIEIPNSPIYRTDIGERVKKQLPKLKELGFCEEWDSCEDDKED